MSDFERRLKELEQAREQQDHEQADVRREIQRLDKRIDDVRRDTPAQIQRELERAWGILACELREIITEEQLSRIRDVALRVYTPPRMPHAGIKDFLRRIFLRSAQN